MALQEDTHGNIYIYTYIYIHIHIHYIYTHLFRQKELYAQLDNFGQQGGDYMHELGEDDEDDDDDEGGKMDDDRHPGTDLQFIFSYI